MNDYLASKLSEHGPKLLGWTDIIRDRLEDIVANEDVAAELYEIVIDEISNHDPRIVQLAIRYHEYLQRWEEPFHGVTDEELREYARQGFMFTCTFTEERELKDWVDKWLDDDANRTEATSKNIWCFKRRKILRELDFLLVEVKSQADEHLFDNNI